jgi:uracil-DNA glycosylase
MKNILDNLDSSWVDLLKSELNSQYFLQLKQFLCSEVALGKVIFPKEKEIFEALNLTPLNKVKVVILGQDPYHGENQAHGLAFSVRPKSSLPPSLRNIFKELHNDLGAPSNSNGYLRSWATQGVLLLNSVLTVEENPAGSHAGYGWERFTDSIISLINSHRERVVFFLWGAYAQNKKKLIDSDKHLILSSSHPSPLSAHRGFFGSKHFSKANKYLTLHSKKCISWN